MAKKPTIRLKKTELPIDPLAAHDHATQNQDRFYQHASRLLAEFHTVDGVASRSRFKTDFEASAFVPRVRAPLKLHRNFPVVASRRLVDAASHRAPWIWKVRESVSPVEYFSNGKASAETFVGQSDSHPFCFEIAFEGKVFTEAVDADTRKHLSDSFEKSKEIRALKRYLARINLQCVKEAIPVFLTSASREPLGRNWTEPDWEGDRIFCPGIVIRTEFCKTWLTNYDYNATSLIDGSNLGRIPAEYDLERAAMGFRGNADVEFLRREMNLEVAFQVISGTHYPVTVPTAWTKEMIFGTDPNPEDVRSGKAPIPPKAEVVMVTTLLERIPEMKRIISTLMRIARPYDHASFLPTDL
jgi:hypothetical protein